MWIIKYNSLHSWLILQKRAEHLFIPQLWSVISKALIEVPCSSQQTAVTFFSSPEKVAVCELCDGQEVIVSSSALSLLSETSVQRNSGHLNCLLEWSERVPSVQTVEQIAFVNTVVALKCWAAWLWSLTAAQSHFQSRSQPVITGYCPSWELDVHYPPWLPVFKIFC